MSVTHGAADEATGQVPHETSEGHAVARVQSRRSRAQHRRRRRIADSLRATVADPDDRLRLLVWSLIGIACLLVAHRMQPDHRLLFAAPAGFVSWAALCFGVVGLWLVPGLWLSALVARTGAGLPAWLGTRIATTLVWYAALGPVIHRSAEGARVTTGGLLIGTIGATGAVLLGVALGMAVRPARLWLRVLIPALVGVVGTRATIWVWTRVQTFGMNYEHIERLDWVIAAAGGVLVTVGMLSRPRLPAAATKRLVAQILAAVAVVAVTFGTIQLTSAIWSPAQQMPSVISVQQTTSPPGADVAFALTALGPEGAGLFERADFIVNDDANNPVPATTNIEESHDAPNKATLLVVLAPDARTMLCGSIQAAKLTVRDVSSGAQVQAFVPDDWCAT